MTNPNPPAIYDMQGDWTAVVRGWREVWACKMGRHQRALTAFHGRPIARCHCGATELDRDGLWFFGYGGKPVGRRSKAEVAERLAQNAAHEAARAKFAAWAERGSERAV